MTSKKRAGKNSACLYLVATFTLHSVCASHRYYKIPDKSYLREKGFLGANGLRHVIVMVAKASEQKLAPIWED